MTLHSYQKKRNFKKTPEPRGNKSKKLSNNLYLIQKHAASHLHYDLRLELDGVLKSWAVPKGPSLDPDVKRLAVHVEDHPVEYGSFEGIIPKGEYGGGTVMLWDTGEWEPLGDARSDYKKGILTFKLKGKKLKGTWKLIRIKSSPKNWLLIKVNDKYASKKDVTEKAKSVKTNKTMEQIAKFFSEEDPFPVEVTPSLCTLVNSPPEGNEWLHEIKFDGYRLIAIIKNKIIRLMTRGKQDWTDKFKNIVTALKKLNLTNAILDGEIVVLDENQQANFQLLQNAISENRNNFIFYLFDIIYFEDKNLSAEPLLARKEILKKILKSSSSKLRFSDHIIGNGKKVYEKACELGLEGIVSKNINSPYQQKRTRDWLKIKCQKRQEFVVGGFTPPKGSRGYFGALLLGVYNKKNEFVYCGRVGTGFTETSLKNMATVLKKQQTVTMPFNEKPPQSKHVTWIKPTVVVEVEFTEWTGDGRIRHPSFKGIRKDKKAKEIKKEISYISLLPARFARGEKGRG